jgi:hypothetical protein
MVIKKKKKKKEEAEVEGEATEAAPAEGGETKA